MSKVRSGTMTLLKTLLRRGATLRLMSDMAHSDLKDLAGRILEVSGGREATRVLAQAIVGTVPEIYPTLNEMRDEYFEMTRNRHIEKSERQYHRWKLP